MKRLVFAFAATAALLACFEPTAPQAPQFLLLSGVWSATTATPGGYYIKMATFAAAGRIDGVGVAYILSTTDSLKIGGEYGADGSFGLSIAFASGQSATFVGPVQGTGNTVRPVLSTGSLSGTWTDWSTGSSYDITFTRLRVPPCADSVPLLGAFDPAAPGFIVRFQDTVNAESEATRLGLLYGFTATHVYAAAIRGFAADMPLSTVTVLRCEPKVASIEYNGIVTIAGPTSRR
jgi:hypothetical protein